ncbi:Uncharacterised protein [Klebsiella pneumoniae]|uniref:Uncharacterized protein n=1 Tax=Klebsiella pneumoniae TaxID=573 RepID=A0A378FXN4_KLEPN|nr:Uncharacterised protein [Klebsiella pneumoniae]
MRCATCQVRRITSPDAAMACESEEVSEKAPEIVQHVFRSDGFPANARLGQGHVLSDVRVQMVADHQHIEMFIDGVEGVGQRWVGGRRQNVRVGAGGDDVRRMAAAGPFGMEGVDGAPPMAARVSSTKPDSFRVSLCRATWTSISSATV